MKVTARDIMSKDVICVPRDMDLRDLAKLFLEKGITGAPVVDGDGDLAGVISQTDLLYYQLTRDDELVMTSDFYASVRVEGHPLPKGFQIEDVNSGRVEDVMTPLVHSVGEGTAVSSVARMMTEKHIHRVIVRRGRKVTGIISALDLLGLVDVPRPKAPAAKRAKAARAKKKAARPAKRRPPK